jgi:hypothetical protein
MKKTAFVILVALAVLAAAACQDNPTSPSEPSTFLKPLAESDGLAKSDGLVIGINALVGTWQATKAEAWSALKPDSRRDLVAEGGTVTLVLKASETYTLTVTMPGAKPGIDTGLWQYSEFWGLPQIDFYPSSIPDPEYGEIPAFLVALSDNTLTLWDSGLTFLPYDFGWNDPPGIHSTTLALVFTRK